MNPCGFRWIDSLYHPFYQYHDRHTMSRLIGAAPGYVGFEEGGELSGCIGQRLIQ